MTDRSVRGLVVGAATLVAVVSSADSIGHASGAPAPTATPSQISAILNASPRTVSFSGAVVGRQSNPKKVTVTNSSVQKPVALEQPTLSGGFVMISNNCPAMLPAGASCMIEVTSAPTAKGKQIGRLQLNSDADFGWRTVKLKGKGLLPKISTRTKSLSFGHVSNNAASFPQSVTIVNPGPAPILLATAPAATPPFNVTANTCDTIAPNGGTCTISVEFAPHSPGKFKGTLEIRDSAANSRLHITLLGVSK